MKKRGYLKALCLILLVCLAPAPAMSFNSAAHVYIADRVYPASNYKLDLRYGSIAPDISLYVMNPARWPFAFSDTHVDFIELMPYTWTGRQRAFSRGWVTHNEDWGADYFAHIEYPPGSGAGYVLHKAAVMEAQLGLDPEFGHFAVETAIDLLLKANDPRLGKKLVNANLFRSWQDRKLLVNVFVRRERLTDWYTVVSTELAFRNLVSQYAAAYSLPPPFDRVALADLGSRLARDMYGIEVSPLEVYALLNYAVSLCQGDYAAFVNDTIEGIKAAVP